MGFYDEWIACFHNDSDDNYYVKSFLYRSVESTDGLELSSNNDLSKIIDFLVSYDKKRIISAICKDLIKTIQSDDVIQFSDFKMGTNDLTNILIYEDNGLTFEELGYKLIGSKSTAAANKYGENHAKVAKGLNLVKFTNERPNIVMNTNLGSIFPYLGEDDQTKLISILLLRDPLILNLIAKAKKGMVYYNDEVACLADSTKKRRKTNVKYILELALNGVNCNFKKNISFK